MTAVASGSITSGRCGHRPWPATDRWLCSSVRFHRSARRISDRRCARVGGCKTALVHPVPAPTATTFVISRSPHAYQRELRRMRIPIIAQSVLVAIQLVAGPPHCTGKHQRVRALRSRSAPSSWSRPLPPRVPGARRDAWSPVGLRPRRGDLHVGFRCVHSTLGRGEAASSAAGPVDLGAGAAPGRPDRQLRPGR